MGKPTDRKHGGAALAFLVGGIAWVLGSDALLEHFVADRALVEVAESLVAVFFVLVGAVVLRALLWQSSRERSAESRLSESESRFRSLVDMAPDALLVHRRGRVLFTNPAGVRMVGAPDAKALVGRELADLVVDSPDSPHRTHPGAHTRAEEGVLFTRLQGRRWSGEPFDADVRTKRIAYDGTGAFLSVVRDVTESVRAAEALARREFALREAERVAHVGHYSWEASTGVVEWSDELLRIWGVASNASADDVAGAIARAIHPDDREAVAAAHRAALADGKARSMDHRIIRSDGAVRHIRTEPGAVEFAPDGSVSRLAGIVQDVTEQVHTARTIAENEERLRLALDGGHQGLWDLDVRTGAAVVSSHYASMLGHDPANFQESMTRLQERTHPDDVPRCAAALWAYLNGLSDSYRVEFRQRTANGEWRWILTEGRIAARDRNGNPTRMLGTHTDVDDLKTAQLTIGDLATRAQVLLEMPTAAEGRTDSEFAAHVAAQLRSLLRSGIALVRCVAGCADDAAPVSVSASDAEVPGLDMLASTLQAASESALRERCPIVRDGDATAPIGATAPGVRFAVVPVIERDKVRMLVAVAGAETDYSTRDVETLALVGATVWRIAQRRRAEAALRANEERYRTLFHANPHPMFVYDTGTLELLDVNDEAIRHYGYERQEFLGLSLVELRPIEDIAAIHHHPDGIEESRAGTSRARHRRRDGKILDVEVSAHDVRYGGHSARVVLVHDVTEQRRAAAAIRENEARMRATLALVGIAVWELSLETGERARSRNYDGLFGLARVEGYDQARYARAVHPDDRALGRGPISRQMAAVEQERFDREFRVIQPDGSVRWLCESGQVVVHDVGAPPRVARGVLIDITERKEAAARIAQLHAALQEHARCLEQRVTERTRELQAANDELEAFASSVSHDLRAPLRAVGGFADALAARSAEALDDEGRRFLSRIQEGATRMGRLIDDLLDLSRMARGELRRERFDLIPIAREVVAELRTREPARSVRVEMPQALWISADAQLVRIVLQNLLENAWKFTGRTGDAWVTLSVDPDAGAQEACVVHDNGVGFDMAYAGKLFGPFQRLHTASEFPGTGIGLATVRRIVARHGGKITAESAPGCGAKFAFTLGPDARPVPQDAMGPVPSVASEPLTLRST